MARETFKIQTALSLVATGLGVTLVTASVLRMRRHRSLGPARDEDQ